jgi:hypothetical protein
VIAGAHETKEVIVGLNQTTREAARTSRVPYDRTTYDEETRVEVKLD